MSAYFDTSYLIALYLPNDHTAAALRHRSRYSGGPIHFTPLHRLELRTVVRQCARARLITEAEARRILRSIEEDLDDGTLLHQPLNWASKISSRSIRISFALAKAEGLHAVLPQ